MGAALGAVLGLTCNLPSALGAGPSAALDQTFAIGHGVSDPLVVPTVELGQIQAVAVQPDGKVLVGGNPRFLDFNGTAVRFFVRVNVDGSLDAPFVANVGDGPSSSTGFGEVHDIVVQPDGKILVAGVFSKFAGVARGGLARLNADGTLDTSFLASGGASPFENSYVNDIALQPDGKILVGGFFISFGGVGRRGVARLNSDGSVDTGFNAGTTGGLGVSTVVQRIGVQSDGKIYLGGSFSNWNGLPTPGLMRLNADGSQDLGFVPTHTIPYPSISTLHVVGDGSILVGGFIEGTEAATSRHFARIKVDGSLDTAFAGDDATDGWVGDIQPWPEGGYLVGGRFRSALGQPRGELVLLRTDGSLDPDFAPAPYPNDNLTNDLVHIYTAAVAPDGKIVVGGWFTNYPNNTLLNGRSYSGLARLVGGYTGGPGRLQFTAADHFAPESGGTVTIHVSRSGGTVGAVSVNYATGSGTATSGTDFTAANGTLSWAAGEGGSKSFTVSITSDALPEPSETILLSLSNPTGGATLGTLSSSKATIIDDDSAPLITTQPQPVSVYLGFNASFHVGVLSGLPVTYQWRSNGVDIAGANSAIFALSGVLTNQAAAYSVRVSNDKGFTDSAAANLTVTIPAGLPDPAFTTPGSGFSAGFNSDIYGVAFQADGHLVVGGSFSQYGGTTIPSYLARLNLDGSRDTAWPVGGLTPNGSVFSVQAYPDGRLLVSGSFTGFGTVGRSRVARLLADGSLDLTYSNANFSVSSVYAAWPLADGGAYIGDNNAIRRVLPDGKTDTNFVSATFNGQVYALAVQADGKIVGASYRSSGAELMRLNPDGSRDKTFNGPGRFNGQILQLSVLASGELLISGGFTTMTTADGSVSVRYLAKVGSDGGSVELLAPVNGVVITHRVQPDGRILIGGDFTLVGEASINRFARLEADGTVDTTFINGTGAGGYVRAFSMDALGRIAIGGQFSTVNSRSLGKVALLTSGPGSVQLSSAGQQVNESVGTVTVNVERVAGSRGVISVNYATVAGSATAGSDFTAANGVLNWADGEAGVKSFPVTINNDGAVEADETFSVVISGLTGDAVFGQFTNQTVLIYDDESVPRFSLLPQAVASAEDVPATFTAAAYSPLPITWQWFSNAVAIANATNASLTVANVKSNTAALYSVRAINANGFTNSPAVALTVYPQPSQRDATFVASPAFNGAVRAIYPLGDGRALVGGDFTQPRAKLALVQSNGVVDTSFTNAVGTSGTVQIHDIDRDAFGRWLIAGQFSQFNGVTVSNLVRLNADFTVDQSFLTALGNPPNGLVRDVTVGPDGKIWIAGDFASVGGPYGLKNLARLDDDGSVDLSFYPRAGNPVYRVLPLETGGALVGGSFSSYDGFGGYFRRILADGSVDRTFSPSVPGLVYDAIALPSGGWILVGNFNNPSPRILKINANGERDAIFLEGATASGAVNSVALTPTGKLVAVGHFATLGIHSNRLTQVNLDGTQDTSLNSGSGFPAEAYRVAVEHTGGIWVGGVFTQYKGASPGYLVRLAGEKGGLAFGQQPLDRIAGSDEAVSFSASVAGTAPLALQWLRDGTPLADGGLVSGANASTLQLALSLVAGGYSLKVTDGTGQSITSRVARLSVKAAPTILAQPTGGIVPLGGRLVLRGQAEGDVPLDFRWFKGASLVASGGPVLALDNASPADSGDYRLVVSNRFGSVTSVVAAVSVQATPATATGGFFADAGAASAGNTIYSLLPLPDGRLLVGGSFSQLKTNGATSTSRSNLGLFSTNGVLDPFNPSPAGTVNDVVRQKDGKILVAGSFNSISNGIVSRRYLVRFNADLSFDTGFTNALGSGPDQAVNDVALQPDGKILLAGGFSSISGRPNTRGIARLHADGSVDDTFVSPANSGGGSMVDVYPDGRILVVGLNVNGYFAAIKRLDPFGTPDLAFTNSLPTPSSIAVLDNDSVLVGGAFTEVNGRPRVLLAKLVGNGVLDTNFLAGVTNVAASNQGVVRTIAVQDNGKIVVGGSFLQFGPFRNGLARFHPDGTPDETFVFQQGIGDDFNASVWRIVPFADGRLAIGGQFASWEGVPENGLAILGGDAVPLAFATHPLDQFVPSGTTVAFSAQAVGTSPISYRWWKGSAPLNDGGNISGAATPQLTVTGAAAGDAGIYFLMATNSTGGQRLSATAELFILAGPVVRSAPAGGTFYTGNGLTLRSTVLGLPTVTYQWLKNSNTVANATNNTLVFTNLMKTDAGAYQLVAANGLGSVTSVVANVVVLDPPASLSGTFPHPAGASGNVNGLVVLGDGGVVIGGDFTSAGANGSATSAPYLAKIKADGSVDTTFAPAINGSVQVVVKDAGGGYLVAGYFTSVGGSSKSGFARIKADGSLDTDFHARLGSGPQSGPGAIAIQPDGKILLGGSFGTVSGQSYPSLVRLNADGSIDPSLRLNMSFAQSIYALGVRADGKIYAGGFLTVSNRQNILRLESSGAVDLAFDASANSQVTKLLVWPDGGVAIGGFFSTVNNASAANLARLAADGSLVSGWPAGQPNGSINAMLLQPNGRLVVGGQFSAIGQTRNRIARLEADGSLDLGFDPGSGFGFQQPYAIGLEADGRIWVGGNFTTYNGTNVNRLLLLNGDPAGSGSGEGGYDGWATSAGLTALNKAPGFDADLDGLPNVYEYFSGTLPLSAASGEAPAQVTANVGGTDYPAIRYLRDKAATGVTPTIRVSSNVLFTDALGSTVFSVTDLGNGKERVVVRSNASVLAHPNQFLELRLSVP